MKNDRVGETNINNQGCPMIVIEYNNSNDIVVEFQDEYKTKIRTQYCNFKSGSVKNPYYPTVYGVGVTGCKYPISINCELTREYVLWHSMLCRCFDERFKEAQPTYKNVSCCKEWLNFEVFYEWLHSQENFDKWLNENKWDLDKDIIVKNNNIYSPEVCCLVPQNVNCLFLKRKADRGELPIGVVRVKELFEVSCSNPFTGKAERLGKYKTVEEAFVAYKQYKENIIKKVAEIEYNKGNITKECYDAMMNYIVEITD